MSLVLQGWWPSHLGHTYPSCVTWPVKVNSVLQELYHLVDKTRQCSIKCAPNWRGSI